MEKTFKWYTIRSIEVKCKIQRDTECDNIHIHYTIIYTEYRLHIYMHNMQIGTGINEMTIEGIIFQWRREKYTVYGVQTTLHTYIHYLEFRILSLRVLRFEYFTVFQ